MDDLTSGSSQFHKCDYCGNYHTFSEKYCEDEHKKDIIIEVWRDKKQTLENDLAKAWAENKQLRNISETQSELERIWENEFIDKCISRVIALEDICNNRKCCGNCKNITQKFDGLVCSLTNRFVECNKVCLDWGSDKKSWLERDNNFDENV